MGHWLNLFTDKNSTNKLSHFPFDYILTFCALNCLLHHIWFECLCFFPFGFMLAGFDDQMLFLFSRCCSQTHSAVMLSSRTTTWWLSCKNVSTTQNGNLEQPLAFFFHGISRTKDLHVLQNFPTKPHIPTLKPPTAFHFHTAHVCFF